jgi:hypothetical protein
MNVAADLEAIRRLSGPQRGVFSRSDLQAALAERHPTQFDRRVRSLERVDVLRRLARGWYVAKDFDLATMSQRLAPDSYISFETVLARELRIGPKPVGRISAVKRGKGRRYEGAGVTIEHVHIAPHLFFGFDVDDHGVKWATAEKAVLDMLYFHLRGRPSLVDVFSDIRLEGLQRDVLDAHLERYRNPKFVAFARGVLERDD